MSIGDTKKPLIQFRKWKNHGIKNLEIFYCTNKRWFGLDIFRLKISVKKELEVGTNWDQSGTPPFEYLMTIWCWCSQSKFKIDRKVVWSDLTKFCHFGNIWKVFGNFLIVYLVYGKCFMLLCQFFAIGQSFTFGNGQILKAWTPRLTVRFPHLVTLDLGT